MPADIISQRILALRALMKAQALDYYFIPGSDPHQTEYVAPHWQRRSFISGFTGSNGDVLIGMAQCYLWTDGRYSLQAKLELDPTLFSVFEYQQGQGATINNFLIAQAKNKRVGVDPMTLTSNQAENLSSALKSNQSELIMSSRNLVDELWTTRPNFQTTPAFIYPESLAGTATSDKLADLRVFMQKEGLDVLALNELTSIAWLFNIRGHDLKMTPVLFSYALVFANNLQLYLEPKALTPELKAYAQTLNMSLLAYQDFYTDLALLKNVRIGLDEYANAFMDQCVQGNDVRRITSPINLTKACKNTMELQAMINAHEEDAVALCQFFTWLEQNWAGETEISVAEKLLEFRQQRPTFYSESFETIAGFKDHGAIIHYHAHAETAYTLSDDALFLLDSGGQYLGGTTDVTRTIHLGTPSPFEQKCYTLVLKGHLALRHAQFPKGTRGEQLDTLARQYLWQQGYNYAHGTGHGVGAFLNVHEGPHRISTAPTTTALLPNMITSNEPGVYFEGKFGIRIENLCYIKEVRPNEDATTVFYTLEDLTLVPYCQKLIEVKLLTAEEISWINAYHREIYARLQKHLDDTTKTWLQHATKPLSF